MKFAFTDETMVTQVYLVVGETVRGGAENSVWGFERLYSIFNGLAGICDGYRTNYSEELACRRCFQRDPGVSSDGCVGVIVNNSRAWHEKLAPRTRLGRR